MHYFPVCSNRFCILYHNLFFCTGTHNPTCQPKDRYPERYKGCVPQYSLAGHVHPYPIPFHHFGHVGKCHELLLRELCRCQCPIYFPRQTGTGSRRSECKFKLQYTECFRIDSQWSGESLRSGLWSFQHGRCTGTILRSNPVIQFSRQPLWKEARVYHLPDADSHLHCAVLFPQ